MNGHMAQENDFHMIKQLYIEIIGMKRKQCRTQNNVGDNIKL